MSPTEADYTRTVVDALQHLGWLAAHHPDSRKLVGSAGMPDIVAVRQGRLAFIELKVKGGRTSAEQVRWAKELDDVIIIGRDSERWALNDHSNVSYHFVRCPEGIDALLKVLR